MRPTARSRLHGLARTAVVALLGAVLIHLGAGPLPWASAQPVGPPAPAGGDLAVSLESSATAIPPDGTLGYTASVRLAQPVSYAQARLQLRRPTGRLVYQKTFVKSGEITGTVSFAWSRDMGDVELEPGAYPLALSFAFERDGKVERREVRTELLVYDPKAARLPIAVVARIEAPPMSDPAGRFVVDPARATGPRDNVRAISETVLGDPQMRVTLAIAPLALEEWRRISEGYETAGPEGVSEVPAESEVPLAYADALDTLARALKTGRLELLDIPYADPDPSELERARLLGDLRPHFGVGKSALFRALDAKPVPGTVLAGQCVPPDAIPLLEGSDVEFVLVEPTCTRSEDSTAPSGVYLLKGTNLTAAVTDPAAAQSISSDEPTAALAASFARQIGEQAGSALIAVVDLGVGRTATVGRIDSFLEDVTQAPWAELSVVSDLTDSDKLPEMTLGQHEGKSTAPPGYWAEVFQGRRQARALELAIGTSDPQAASSIIDSLIAESSAWAGPDQKWSLADRGRAFAASATRLSQSVLGDVTVETIDITLSSARGSVPVSITNPGEKTLTLTLRTYAEGFEVVGQEERSIEVPPQESVVDIPVDLRSALSGSLTVELRSGPIVLDTAEARVSASILDRLAVIGAIVVVLLAALYFIVRRVRTAEEKDDGSEPTL